MKWRGHGLRRLVLRLICLASATLWPVVALVVDDAAPFSEAEYVFVYEFGLAPGAVVSFQLTNAKPVNNTYVMVLTHSQLYAWQKFLHEPDGRDDIPSSYFGTFWRKGFYDKMEATFKIESAWSDRYTILVMNPMRHKVHLAGSLSLVNPGGEELRLEDKEVPKVLIWASALFATSCAFFGLLLTSLWREGRSAMHVLMILVLLFKSVVLFLNWCDMILVSRTGKHSVLNQYSWQLLDKVQTILELMMFLLVSLGWKFLRPSLNVTEVRFAVGISVISFYLGIFEVACKTPATCNGYKLSRYILHALCYLVVIVAMNFNLQMVQAQISDAPATQEAGKLYQKHRAYRHFRWIFLVFIIAPTVELFVKVSMMPWYARWAYWLMQHLRTWMIYMFMIAAFRPEPDPLRVFELTIRTGSDEGDSEANTDEYAEDYIRPDEATNG